MQLKIEHLSFTYDGAPEAVFADLSLSLDTAWRTGLIARNGRGKTTLLRLLSGDLQGKGKIDCPLMPVPIPRRGWHADRMANCPNRRVDVRGLAFDARIIPSQRAGRGAQPPV